MIRFVAPEALPAEALEITASFDGDEGTAKRSLLAALAVTLEFPPWFGENWDALADALSDVPAPVTVALPHATSALRAHPHVLATLVELWADEARGRAARGEHFELLLLL